MNCIKYNKIQKLTGIAVMLSLVCVTNVYASVNVGTITSPASHYPTICHDKACNSVGYVNMRPTLIYASTSQVTITDTHIYGYAYGNEIGWINMSPTISSTTIHSTRVNPNTGVLSGYAYSQLGSWINWSPTSVGTGVAINGNGEWNGWAWVSGINGGWLHFDCSITSSSLCITTDWRPIAFRTVSTTTTSGGSGGGGIIIIPTATTTNTNTSNSTSTTNVNQNYVPDNTNNQTTPSYTPGSSGNTGSYNTPSTNETEIYVTPTSTASTTNDIGNIFNSVKPYTNVPKVEEYKLVFPKVADKYVANKPCFFCAVLRHEVIELDPLLKDNNNINSSGVASNVTSVYNTPILKIAVVPTSLEYRAPISDTIAKALGIVGPNDKKPDIDLTSIALVSVAVLGLWRMVIIRAVSVFLKL